MRKLLLVVGILVILGGIIGLALRNLNGIINRNKDYVLAQAQQRLGRQVTVGEISVSMWKGIGVRLSNVALADDPAFSQDQFLQAADLQIDVEFLPLFWEELRIKRMILHRPTLIVIRNAQGQLNLASLGGVAAKEQPFAQEQPSTTKPPPASTSTSFPLFAAFLNLAGGVIHYIDQQQQTDLRITQLDLTVTDFSLNRPFQLDLDAALFAERQNLKLQSRIGPFGSTLVLKELPIAGTLEMQSLALNTLLQAFPPISKQLPQGFSADGPLSLKTQVQGTVGNLTLAGTVDASPGALHLDNRFQKPSGTPLVLSLDARIAPQTIALQKATLRLHTLELVSDGTINLEEPRASNLTVELHPTPLAGWGALFPAMQNHELSGQLEAHARVEGAAVVLENVSLQAFGGSVQGKGQYTFQQTPPQFTLTSQTHDLNLIEIFRLMSTPASSQIEGQANLDLTLEGRGSGWEEIQPSLQGKGQLDVLRGAILNMNIAEGVLSGVTSVPGLSSLISSRLRERYPEIFATQHGKFNELRSVFVLRNSKVNIDTIHLTAPDYAVQGTGWLDFHQQLDLRAQLLLSQKLSADIATDVKEAQYIVNKQRQMEIPFAVVGTLPNVRPQPDVAYVGRLVQHAAMQKGTEELKKHVLKRLLPFS